MYVKVLLSITELVGALGLGKWLGVDVGFNNWVNNKKRFAN